MNTAQDAGRDRHRDSPDQLLVTVAREATDMFPHNKDLQLAYLLGYVDARKQRDEYLHEKELERLDSDFAE
jgi:hypothetical protein